MKHLIYKITNTLNGRFYIGMHTGFEDDGYIGSGKRIRAEIKKHGKENFSKEILEVCSDRKSLEQREAAIVNEELLIDPLCLNLKNGGEGGGRFWSKEQQLNATIAGNMSPKRKSKLINDKITATKKLRGTMVVPNPATFGMLGKNHSNKTKQKMSLSGSGEKNSQFGSCWVMIDGKSIKIKKEFLNEYLAKGYSKGRIMKIME
jgi:group I intron endonuclease